MESLRATYRDEEDDQAEEKPVAELQSESPQSTCQPPESGNNVAPETGPENEAVREPELQNGVAQKPEPVNGDAQETEVRNGDAQEPEPRDGNDISQEPALQTEPIASDTMSEDEPTASDDTQKSSKRSNSGAIQNDEEEEEEDDEHPPKKQKPLSSLTNHVGEQEQQAEGEQTPVANNNVTSKTTTSIVKKSKKKNNNVWVTKTTRKGKKKSKTNTQNQVPTEDTVMITPIMRFPDKGDDNTEMTICLSKINKAEKVELSEDRLTAGSTKGYRMVRATRGVVEGAWYFEIKVVKLGESGHTRLGWSTGKGDLQAPVGYDGNSFGYRDIDGSKVHKALREKYGEEGYKEGDVIGFYINLPEGEQYAPKIPRYVWFKGQRYLEGGTEGKDEPLKLVPGSELSFFKNGVCQGVAFNDLFGGRYYPAASMYTLPNQPNCTVKFNFGPDFELFPEDFGGRPIPRPMIEVPYHGMDIQAENGVPEEKKS